ncbi:MAG: response regulator [Cyclobacteriaceae bacterium]|jgi:DNA-binding response OmpR family regulator|nr:response regulator [Cyclobacteriaceae bacterium]
MKILVVHRQREIADQIRSVLQSVGSILRYSSSGLDGLLAARIETFDLIICGTDLPVITGFEMVRSLRTNSVNKNTPVVFVADEVSREMESLGSALNASDMLTPADVTTRLASIVRDQVRAAPDNRWEDLLTKERVMN